jgi:hypothetical protein
MKVDRSFLNIVAQNIASAFNIWATIISLILAFIAWWGISPDKSWPVRYIFLMIIFFIFVTLLLFRVAWVIYKESGIALPSVKQATQYGANQSGILILGSSKLFGHNSIVAIYYTEDQFERLIGMGIVSNIQENGLIQVVVERHLPECDELWKAILSNKADKIKNLIVKPHAPAELWRIPK